MYSATTICALATICCFSVGNADPNTGTDALLEMNIVNVIVNATNYLNSYGVNIERNMREKLSDLTVEGYKKKVEIITSAIKAMELEVNDKMAAGKNVDYCYEHSRHRAEETSFDYMNVIYFCHEAAFETINSIKASVDVVVRQCEDLITELEMISNNCYSSDDTDPQLCITAKIPKARSSLDAYLNAGNVATRNGDKTILDILPTVQQCYQPGIKALREAIEGIRADNRKCIAEA